jgi:ASC-1-like (ASCH) protein
MSDTHYMHLRQGPFDKIESGLKTIEIRLLDEKRKKLKVGDRIVFQLENDANQIVATEITDLICAPTFKKLIKKVCIRNLGCEAGTGDELANSYYQYYSPEDEQKLGTIAIEMKKVVEK